MSPNPSCAMSCDKNRICSPPIPVGVSAISAPARGINNSLPSVVRSIKLIKLMVALSGKKTILVIPKFKFCPLISSWMPIGTPGG